MELHQKVDRVLNWDLRSNVLQMGTLEHEIDQNRAEASLGGLTHTLMAVVAPASTTLEVEQLEQMVEFPEASCRQV